MKRELLVPSGVIKVKRTKALGHESSRMGLVVPLGTGKCGLIKNCRWLQ